jgi:hypothetical protein
MKLPKIIVIVLLGLLLSWGCKDRINDPDVGGNTDRDPPDTGVESVQEQGEARENVQ